MYIDVQELQCYKHDNGTLKPCSWNPLGALAAEGRQRLDNNITQWGVGTGTKHEIGTAAVRQLQQGQPVTRPA
jgi:hypothetical protein